MANLYPRLSYNAPVFTIYYTMVYLRLIIYS